MGVRLSLKTTPVLATIGNEKRSASTVAVIEESQPDGGEMAAAFRF